MKKTSKMEDNDTFSECSEEHEVIPIADNDNFQNHLSEQSSEQCFSENKPNLDNIVERRKKYDDKKTELSYDYLNDDSNFIYLENIKSVCFINTKPFNLNKNIDLKKDLISFIEYDDINLEIKINFTNSFNFYNKNRQLVSCLYLVYEF